MVSEGQNISTCKQKNKELPREFYKIKSLGKIKAQINLVLRVLSVRAREACITPGKRHEYSRPAAFGFLPQKDRTCHTKLVQSI